MKIINIFSLAKDGENYHIIIDMLKLILVNIYFEQDYSKWRRQDNLKNKDSFPLLAWIKPYFLNQLELTITEIWISNRKKVKWKNIS